MLAFGVQLSPSPSCNTNIISKPIWDLLGHHYQATLFMGVRGSVESLALDSDTVWLVVISGVQPLPHELALGTELGQNLHSKNVNCQININYSFEHH